MEEISNGAWFMEKRGRLENVKEVVAEFEKKTKCRRWQKKLDMAKERDFRRGELLGKYIVKILYGWDNGKFEKKNT